jgi:hypothetical protein
MSSISTNQLSQLKQQVNALSPANSAEVAATLGNIYGTLQAEGFTYAGWGKGVVEQNTISGISRSKRKSKRGQSHLCLSHLHFNLANY